MMRALASAALLLYPRAWRRRYADEVMDVVDARPIRLRTVADLVAGAFDAHMNAHLIPGGPRMRVLTPLALVTGTMALLALWNPGVRQVSSLDGTWATALENGGFAADLMAQAATVLFIAAPVFGLIAVVPLLVTCARTIVSNAQGTSIVVLTLSVLLLSLAGLVGALYVGMAFFDLGFPLGRLGDAMTGGFFVPIMLALLLPIPLIAAPDPLLGHDVRSTGRLLALAAALNALGWLPIVILLALGRSGASTGFVLAVAASAGCGITMSAVVARRALGKGSHATGAMAHA